MSGCGGGLAQDKWVRVARWHPRVVVPERWVRARGGARHAGVSGALASTGVVLVHKMSGCGGARNVGLLGRAWGGARHVATRRVARNHG
jgi:hypothetical protein